MMKTLNRIPLDKNDKAYPISVFDLMLGNVVYKVNEFDKRIIGIRNDDFKLSSEGILFGIPIDEKILECFGFQAIGSCWSLKLGHGYFINYETDNGSCTTELISLQSGIKIHHTHIKCIHQIQNLHRIITGHDLSIDGLKGYANCSKCSDCNDGWCTGCGAIFDNHTTIVP